jgi:hypothetical protein
VYALGYKLEISPELRQAEKSVPEQPPALVRTEGDGSDACNSLTA